MPTSSSVITFGWHNFVVLVLLVGWAMWMLLAESIGRRGDDSGSVVPLCFRAHQEYNYVKLVL